VFNLQSYYCSLIHCSAGQFHHSSHPRKLQLQDLITELENVKTILSAHYTLTEYAPQSAH